MRSKNLRKQPGCNKEVAKEHEEVVNSTIEGVSTIAPERKACQKWTLQSVAAIAAKYQTRKEYSLKDNAAYVAGIRHGWHDIVCSHMRPPPKSHRLGGICLKRRKPENLIKLRDFAILKGGILLTEEYETGTSKYLFRCKDGHEFEMDANHILNRGSWCPYDSRNKIENPLLELQLIAQKKNGAVLSEAYIGSKGKMEFKCGNGHAWNATASTIRSGTWCPACKFKTESLVRSLLEIIFSTRLPHVGRLIGNQRIIFDGYCEKSRLAFEYYGEQHTEHSKIFHNAKRTLKWQMYRDELVRTFCKEKDIHLIEINYLHYRDIDTFLEKITPQLHVQSIEVSAEHVDIFRNMKIHSLDLQKLKDHANSEDGKLLSTSFFGMTHKYEWCCGAGHKWKTTADSVVNGGSWCIVCAGLKLENPLEELKELARKKGGACLSGEYVNSQTKMLFQCNDKKHGSWWATPNSIRRDSWCYKCSRNYIADPIKELAEISQKKGWKLVSQDYVNAHTKLIFECSKNKHQISCRPTSMKSIYIRCPSCTGRPKSPKLVENQI